jgi:hypothetical protein
MTGNACAMPTAPVQIGFRVASHTWYRTATSVSWPPSPDSVRPSQSRR